MFHEMSIETWAYQSSVNCGTLQHERILHVDKNAAMNYVVIADEMDRGCYVT
jgi:hypothetical protein